MPFLTIPPKKQTRLRLKDIFKKNTPEGLRKLPTKKKALSSSPPAPPPFVQRFMHFVSS